MEEPFFLANITGLVFDHRFRGRQLPRPIPILVPTGKRVKGQFRVGSPASLSRRVLTVFQFCVSITLITCTLVVFRQVQFAKERPAGYQLHDLLLLPLTGGDFADHFEAFRTDLIKSGAVINAATSESTTTDIWGTEQDVHWQGKDPALSVDFPNTGVSPDYGKTVGWKFLQGRDFTTSGADSFSLIINESAVHYMKLTKPIGQIVQVHGKPHTVIGVIRNVIVESPYEDVRPAMYCLARPAANFAVIKMNPAKKTSDALASIEAVFKEYSRSTPFNYVFVNDQYDEKFRSEEQVAKLLGIFCALSIFISCLGLFGMVSFMIEQRKKEISVRKVLGSSAVQIWQLLTGNFSRVVLVSLAISTPLAIYLTSVWLQNYSYRAPLSWWLFVVSGAGALLIAVLTISIESIKAVLDNPVNGLRNH